jgi:hypothetical protein
LACKWGLIIDSSGKIKADRGEIEWKMGG